MRWLLVATVVAAGVVAASASAAQAPDPCTLITTVDASTVFGSNPPKPKPTATVGLYRACSYVLKKKTITVMTRRIPTQALFDRSAKANPGVAIPIQGVGADAWSVANGTGLLVWKNGIEITLLFVGVSPFVATQQALAKTAVGRL